MRRQTGMRMPLGVTNLVTATRRPAAACVTGQRLSGPPILFQHPWPIEAPVIWTRSQAAGAQRARARARSWSWGLGPGAWSLGLISRQLGEARTLKRLDVKIRGEQPDFRSWLRAQRPRPQTRPTMGRLTSSDTTELCGYGAIGRPGRDVIHICRASRSLLQY